MINFVSGDFFKYDADIMINTVNCVGVMGKGVALAFKKRYPEMFDDYVVQCKKKIIRPGHPSVWIENDIISKQVEIINFPTKDNWKSPSEYTYIEEGLKWLSNYLSNKETKIVTIPALGCGHGGLDWNIVKPMISNYLKDSKAEIYVFEPYDSINIAKSDSDYDEKSLLIAGIESIRHDSSRYPEHLKILARNNLYVFPNTRIKIDFDFSIICSTKPSAIELELIEKFCEYCYINQKSIIFGSSAYEKKLALRLAKSGIKCACMLPSGILDAALKLKGITSSKNIHLLSMGDPKNNFDKKEFIPSVLGRINISENSIFFTSNLAWLGKYTKLLSNARSKLYYCNSGLINDADLLTVQKIGLTELVNDIFPET